MGYSPRGSEDLDTTERTEHTQWGRATLRGAESWADQVLKLYPLLGCGTYIQVSLEVILW